MASPDGGTPYRSPGEWLSWRSWSTHRPCGRPGRRFQSTLHGNLLRGLSTCSFKAWWAGVVEAGSLATRQKQKTAVYRWGQLIDGSPVRKEVSAFRILDLATWSIASYADIGSGMLPEFTCLQLEWSKFLLCTAWPTGQVHACLGRRWSTLSPQILSNDDVTTS